jgi:cytochrome c553
MKNVKIPGLSIILSAAALAIATPAMAFFNGDTIYASSDGTAYCKSIKDLDSYTALLKAKSDAEANKIAGCGILKKNTKATAVDISSHGYAIVRLEGDGGAATTAFVKKNLWWTKVEEKYFMCMRVHSSDNFTDAYKHCQEESVAGGDAQSSPETAVAYQCAECHGAVEKDGKPSLDGLSKNYILKSVNAYKHGARDDSKMSGVAKKLSEEDASRAANYYSQTPCK